MLVDANILIYATDERSRFHDASKAWLTGCLNDVQKVGIPWQSITAFIRLTTNPRIFSDPLPVGKAWTYACDWLDAEVAWIPAPGLRYRQILEHLVDRYEPAGNAFPDAMLAALAIEHGLAVYSADTDFARFTEIEWRNPAVPRDS